MSNYPPGVSLNDPHLTGLWPCVNCGCVLPEDCDGDECPDGCYEADPDLAYEVKREREHDDWLEEPR